MVQALYAPALWPAAVQGESFGVFLDGLVCLCPYEGTGLASAEQGDGAALYAMYYDTFADMHPQTPDMVGILPLQAVSNTAESIG
jgi:hypothetical protein